MAENFGDQLRRAVNECGMTRYQLSQKTGIPQSVLSRFIHGERGLAMDSISKLVDVLGLELRACRKRKDG
jgi:predicted transcriptional regulator